MTFEAFKKLDNTYIMPTYNRLNIAFIKGQNSTLFDTTGKDYIDFTSGIGVCGIGHGNKQLADDIAKQASEILHTSNIFYIPNQAILAEKIITLFGADVPYKVFFANSGAEANECAIKIARKYGEQSNRYEIITLNHSFHGRTIATLKATGQDKFHEHFTPFPEGFIKAENLEDIENKISNKTIAVLIELIQGEGGVKEQDIKQVKALEQLCKKHNILLMVDEVQSGIYRSGEFLTSKKYNITPNVITMAKSLGGGVPIGACMSNVESLQNGDHGSTFGGNPLSTQAGITTLKILEDLHKSGKLAQTIQIFDSNLKNVLTKYPNIFLTQTGLGLMCGLKVRDEDTLSQIINLGIKHGILMLKAGQNTLRFLPPLTISQSEIELGFARFNKVLESIK